MQMPYNSPIILAGPTTVGKTEIAKELADRTSGQIINADRYYLYAGKHFMLGLGLEPCELTDGRQRQLFGNLHPHDTVPSPEEYVAMADQAVNLTHAAGCIAIIEGCTYDYLSPLMKHFGLHHAVNITWANKQGLPMSLEKRAQRTFKQGLYEETQNAIDAGLADAFPMTSIMYQQTMRVLRKEASQAEAIDCMVVSALETAIESDGHYRNTVGLRRFAHDRSNVGQTVTDIQSHLQRIAV